MRDGRDAIIGLSLGIEVARRPAPVDQVPPNGEGYGRQCQPVQDGQDRVTPLRLSQGRPVCPAACTSDIESRVECSSLLVASSLPVSCCVDLGRHHRSRPERSTCLPWMKPAEVSQHLLDALVRCSRCPCHDPTRAEEFDLLTFSAQASGIVDVLREVSGADAWPLGGVGNDVGHIVGPEHQCRFRGATRGAPSNDEDERNQEQLSHELISKLRTEVGTRGCGCPTT